MEEDIQIYLPTVMFSETPYILAHHREHINDTYMICELD